MVLIFKPPWIEHANESGKRHRIFTLHASPDGTRLATGGMDSSIKVWDVVGLDDQENVRSDRLVSTVQYSTGAVMCVRWSPTTGRYLAAACDDGKVLIMEKDRTGLRGSFGDANKEVYALKASMTLGHTDVAEVAWSYDDQPQLAACTLDGYIFVWDAAFNLVVKFKGHADFTKGLAWDPIGTYLASASDDRTVKVWRTDNWKEVETVEKPFRGAPAVTMYRRLSWAPDGSYLVAPVAANALFNVAALVSRKKWKSELSIVGHSAAIECASFSPVLYEVKKQSGKPGTKYVSMIALAGQDQSISITPSHSRTALFASVGLFSKPAVDISWSPCGLKLFVCSMDGSVAYLSFSEEELGRPLSFKEQSNILSTLGAAKHRQREPLESLQQLQLEKLGEKMLAVEENVVATMLNSVSVAPDMQPVPLRNATVTKQSVSVDAKSGKKRIQPTFLSTLDGSPISKRIVPTFNPSAPPLSQSTQAKDEGVPAELVVNENVLPTWLALSGASVKIPADFLPKVQDTLLYKFKCEGDNRWVCVTNYQAPRPHSAELRVMAAKPDSLVDAIKERRNIIWEDCSLFFRVTAVAASGKLVLASLSDNSILAYSSFGRRLYPPMHSSAGSVVSLSIGDNHWSLLDSMGHLHIWEIDSLSLSLTLSLAPLLEPVVPEDSNGSDGKSTVKRKLAERRVTVLGTLGVLSVVLQSTGVPIVTTTALQSFAYVPAMGVWVRTTLHDLSSALVDCVGPRAMHNPSSVFSNPRTLSKMDYSSTLLTPLSGETFAVAHFLNTERPIPLPGVSFEEYNFAVSKSGRKTLPAVPFFYSTLPKQKRLEAESRWVEWQLGAAKLVASTEAYKHYLYMYCMRLGEIGSTALGRAQEILEELKSPKVAALLGDEVGAVSCKAKTLLAKSRSFQSLFVELEDDRKACL